MVRAAPAAQPPAPRGDRLGRRLARARTPRSVFDYVDGAAEEELSLTAARRAFREVQVRPHVLRDVSSVSTARRVLGREATLPLVLAPTGFTRMMHHEGKLAVARDHGYDTLVLTVDTPVAGARLRDARNGMTIPPTLGPRTLADIARHPAWWLNLLTTAPLEFASLTRWEGTVGELVGKIFDPSAALADLAWLREAWPGSLVVKGNQRADDAEAVVGLGADAVVVSNHGGRQLDRTPVPLRLLPDVIAAIGDRAEVLLDTGVLSGADLVAALGLGATGVPVGRAYLYGLMAGGERGVTRALDIFAAETRRTLQLLGARSPADLEPGQVVLPALSGRACPPAS
nr:alpha-hydroxy acid oxidase [Crossiella equi]